MELTFEKQNNFYVSEFQLTSDANLHIEKSTGKLQLFQRTIGAGDYAEVKDFDTSDYDSDKIIDIDLQSLVYPKWIKIKSAVKPLIATITTDGEVNEVVYQAKDIEITSNGTTKVTADTGYTALGSVNVKVNVPTEGGGENNIEYFKYNSNIEKLLSTFAVAIKLIKKDDNSLYIASYTQTVAGLKEVGFEPIAFGINFKDTVYIKQGDSTLNMTVLDMLIQNRITKEEIDAVPRMSKEEFYRLPKSYEVINYNPDGNGEELKDFFEDAWSYLTAYAPAKTYIPFVPYPFEYIKIVYPSGNYDEYGSYARTALWNSEEHEDGTYEQNIQLDSYAGIFRKLTYSDGTIEYIFEILS